MNEDHPNNVDSTNRTNTASAHRAFIKMPEANKHLSPPLGLAANVPRRAVANNSNLYPNVIEIPASISTAVSAGDSVSSDLTDETACNEDIARRSFAALDDLLQNKFPAGFDNLDGFVKMGVPIPFDLIKPGIVNKSNKGIQLKLTDLSRFLPEEKCTVELLALVNTSLSQLRSMFDMIAWRAIDRVISNLRIKDGIGGWIDSRQELRREIDFCSNHESAEQGCAVALKGAFACSIFQKCNNKEYGRKVVQFVSKRFNLNLQESPLCIPKHCFVSMAVRQYDRVGHSVLNYLRGKGSIYWRTNPIKKVAKQRNAVKVGQLFWRRYQLIYFYRKISDDASDGEVQ